MIKMKKIACTLILCLLFFTASTYLSDNAALAQEEVLQSIVLLSLTHDSETKDFYNYSPAESLQDIKYFVVAFWGMQDQITTFTIKLSSAPIMTSYEGRVTYTLFAAGLPNILFADIETATDTTAASNSIKADFPINAEFGFAVVGATVLSRHDVDDEVKMSIKFSVE